MESAFNSKAHIILWPSISRCSWSSFHFLHSFYLFFVERFKFTPTKNKLLLLTLWKVKKKTQLRSKDVQRILFQSMQWFCRINWCKWSVFLLNNEIAEQLNNFQIFLFCCWKQNFQIMLTLKWFIPEVY